MSIRSFLKRLLLNIEKVFDAAFGQTWNPWRQLGTMSFFFYWIAAVSGIYVYILFDTSVEGAFDSVEYMTYNQWYIGGIMRSLHRYASDAIVVTTILHLLREFILDRYRDVRWYAWFTGLPILWFLFMSGVSGYWLVWDELAQYIAITSTHWIDWIGIFGEPIATNFLTYGSLTDRFFTLLVFIHIFVPLFLLFLMWIHLLRVHRARFNPPRVLILGTLAMLVALSLVSPAVSHTRADLGMLPNTLNLDWFYLIGYTLFDAWGAGPLWVLAILCSMILSVLPWLPPRPTRPVPAEVHLEQCSGCRLCVDDCPFSAITMVPRNDGRPFLLQAEVDPALCSGCGICVGACPASQPQRKASVLVTGIDRPDFLLTELRHRTLAALEHLSLSVERPRILVFSCLHSVEIDKSPEIASLRLPCVGMVPPSFIDFALASADVEGVLLAGCRRNDCFHRWGDILIEERLAALRKPYLRHRVPRRCVRTFWGAETDIRSFYIALTAFRNDLCKL